MSQSAARTARRRSNGATPDPEMVALPRELLQAILDYLVSCPAGQVYPLLRALDAELGLGAPAQPVESPPVQQPS